MQPHRTLNQFVTFREGKPDSNDRPGFGVILLHGPVEAGGQRSPRLDRVGPLTIGSIRLANHLAGADMTTRILWTLAAGATAIAISVQLPAQTRDTRANQGGTWNERTPWAIRNCRGSGPPKVNMACRSTPGPYGTRQFLTDAEHAKRLEDVRARDERDLARVDVLSGKVEGPNTPIPHWREYNTTSRHTSLVIDPADGRLPPRTPQARPVPVQRCAACSAASHATPTKTTASASAASCTAAGCPTRWFRRSTTRTCAFCKVQGSWPSATS